MLQLRFNKEEEKEVPIIRYLHKIFYLYLTSFQTALFVKNKLLLTYSIC